MKRITGNPWLKLLLFVITLLALGFGLSYLVQYLPLGQTLGEEGETPGLATVAYALVSVVASLLTVYFFRRKIDRQSITSLGLLWKNNKVFAATGFFAALFLLGVGVLILFWNKNLEFVDAKFDGSSLYVGFGLMAFIAVSEELAFRGYILNTLLPVTNRWVALLVSALIFAILHMGNPGANLIPVVNVFLAGLLLGVNYIYTRNLWFSILLHFAWNFVQGPVLGFKVSGIGLQSVLQQKLEGPSLLTGGDFGWEGSAIAGTLLLVATLCLGWIYQKKFIGTVPKA